MPVQIPTQELGLTSVLAGGWIHRSGGCYLEVQLLGHSGQSPRAGLLDLAQILDQTRAQGWLKLRQGICTALLVPRHTLPLTPPSPLPPHCSSWTSVALPAASPSTCSSATAAVAWVSPFPRSWGGTWWPSTRTLPRPTGVAVGGRGEGSERNHWNVDGGRKGRVSKQMPHSLHAYFIRTHTFFRNYAIHPHISSHTTVTQVPPLLPRRDHSLRPHPL